LEESGNKKTDKENREAQYKSAAKTLNEASEVAKNAEKAANLMGDIAEATGDSETSGILKYVSKVFCCLSCVAKGSSRGAERAGGGDKGKDKNKKQDGTGTKFLKGVGTGASVVKGAASAVGTVAPYVVDDETAESIKGVTSTVGNVAGGAGEVFKGAAAISGALDSGSDKEKGEKEENDMEKVGKVTEGLGNVATGVGKIAEAAGDDSGFAQQTQEVGGKVKSAGKLTKKLGSFKKFGM